VEAQAYWAQLSRYIHRNPLEAGLVTHLDAYLWPNPAYLDKRKRPTWLTCAYILTSLASSRVIDEYKIYVVEGIDEEIMEWYAKKKQPPILGSNTFKKKLKFGTDDIDVPDLRQARVKPTVTHIVEVVCQRLDVDVASVWASQRGRGANNPARGMAMYVCQREGDMKLGEIARKFGMKHYASASTGIRQFEARLAKDKRLQKCLELIKLDLTLCAMRCSSVKAHIGGYGISWNDEIDLSESELWTHVCAAETGDAAEVGTFASIKSYSHGQVACLIIYSLLDSVPTLIPPDGMRERGQSLVLICKIFWQDN